MLGCRPATGSSQQATGEWGGGGGLRGGAPSSRCRGGGCRAICRPERVDATTAAGGGGGRSLLITAPAAALVILS